MINAFSVLLKKLNFSIILLTLLAISGCQRKAEKNLPLLKKDVSANIELRVDVTPENSNAVYLSYLNEVGDKELFEVNKNQKTADKFNIATTLPVFVLDWSPNQIYYVLYPAETIQIIASNSSKETWSVSALGKDSIRANELKFFEALSLNEVSAQSEKINGVLKKLYRKETKTGPSNARILVLMDMIKRKKLKDPAVAYQFISSKYKKRQEFLNRYVKEHPISQKYRDLVSQFFKYEFDADLMEVLGHALKKNVLLNDSLLTYGNGVLKDLNCDSCLSIPTYQYAVRNYLSFIFAKNNLNTLKSKVDYINGNFKTGTRDFCLFLIFKQQDTFDAPSDRNMVLDFINKSKNPAYIDYLKKKLSFNERVSRSNPGKETLLRTVSGGSFTFEKLLNSLKGKVVLIDFWASWCVPCKVEMPFSHELGKEFKNQKFSIVYLSLDKSANDWLKSAETLNLSVNSFLVEKDFKSPLAIMLKITAIPRYLLIDKEGRIVDSKAPRPSNPELKQMIKKLLNP